MGGAQFLTKVKGVARKIWDHAHKGTHSNFCLDPPLDIIEGRPLNRVGENGVISWKDFA